METPAPTDFDAYADHYGRALETGLSVSGEKKDFFARGRVAWLAGLLEQMDFTPRVILDFGCGTGGSTPYFVELLKPERIIGVDVSEKSVNLARVQHGAPTASFHLASDFKPDSAVDLAFCNGVFHHIRPGERPAAARRVFEALRPGGLFAFWENNPWNPGTQWVMSRIAFDRDAIKLSAPEARRLLRESGFDVRRTDFLFVFPRWLGALRFLEPALSRFPLGAQYLVLARKPG